MWEELVATLEILVPHLGVEPVDRNAQHDQFRHATKESVGHTSDLRFESAMHEADLGQRESSRRHRVGTLRLRARPIRLRRDMKDVPRRRCHLDHPSAGTGLELPDQDWLRRGQLLLTRLDRDGELLEL